MQLTFRSATRSAAEHAVVESTSIHKCYNFIQANWFSAHMTRSDSLCQLRPSCWRKSAVRMHEASGKKNRHANHLVWDNLCLLPDPIVTILPLRLTLCKHIHERALTRIFHAARHAKKRRLSAKSTSSLRQNESYNWTIFAWATANKTTERIVREKRMLL